MSIEGRVERCVERCAECGLNDPVAEGCGTVGPPWKMEGMVCPYEDAIWARMMEARAGEETIGVRVVSVSRVEIPKELYEDLLEVVYDRRLSDEDVSDARITLFARDFERGGDELALWARQTLGLADNPCAGVELEI